MTRRFAPYAVAIGGVMAITAVVWLVNSLTSVPGLSAIYLLLVLWLGARWGRGPAVVGSIGAFLFYDFFFVPPVNTFTVRDSANLLELIVLLAAALVTSQLAASSRRSRATAEALARESRALYEVATAALRSAEVTAALSMLCKRALEQPSLSRFALVAVDAGQPSALAGGDLSPAELRQAAWSHENGKAIGIAVRDGVVSVVRKPPSDSAPAYLPLASGAAVIGIDEEHVTPDELRMLAALIGLADLLMDRRRAALAGSTAWSATSWPCRVSRRDCSSTAKHMDSRTWSPTPPGTCGSSSQATVSSSSCRTTCPPWMSTRCRPEGWWRTCSRTRTSGPRRAA